MNAADRYSDAWGRIVLRTDTVFTRLYDGLTVNDGLLVEDSSDIQDYNHWCAVFDEPTWKVAVAEHLSISPTKSHAKRRARWFMPDAFNDIDVRAFMLSLCTTAEQHDRIIMEMGMFEARGLVGLLRYLIYMVDTLHENNVVWGVGRGSSVASYCLYLIGVHKVDSLRYGLDISEFLR